MCDLWHCQFQVFKEKQKHGFWAALPSAHSSCIGSFKVSWLLWFNISTVWHKNLDGGNNSAFEGWRLKEKDHGKVKMRRIFISGRVKWGCSMLRGQCGLIIINRAENHFQLKWLNKATDFGCVWGCQKKRLSKSHKHTILVQINHGLVTSIVYFHQNPTKVISPVSWTSCFTYFLNSYWFLSVWKWPQTSGEERESWLCSEGLREMAGLSNITWANKDFSAWEVGNESV